MAERTDPTAATQIQEQEVHDVRSPDGLNNEADFLEGHVTALRVAILRCRGPRNKGDLGRIVGRSAIGFREHTNLGRRTYDVRDGVGMQTWLAVCRQRLEFGLLVEGADPTLFHPVHERAQGGSHFRHTNVPQMRLEVELLAVLEQPESIGR